MAHKLPLFPVTVVGSWPRSDKLLRALSAKRAGRIDRAEFHKIADEAALHVLRLQEEAGVDIVSDGEQRRDNFIAFVADKLENVRMLTLAELLDYVEDKSAFEEILGSLDVPAFSMVNPAATGPIRRREPLALDEYTFLRRHTDKPIKVALPGPYLLTRSMWVEGLSETTYSTKEDLAADVVRVLREELIELQQAGVQFVQFDEPVLTELVFTKRIASRTFMCGALSARRDAAEELELAVRLLNEVVDGIVTDDGWDNGAGNGEDKDVTPSRPSEAMRIGLHVCRGNWSTQEDVLLEGSYEPLIPYLDKMKVDQLVLEFATPRAGSMDLLYGRPHRELGLGVTNPRTPKVESPEEIVAHVERALDFYPPGHIFLNPDCGFGTFSNRPMNDEKTAVRKLKAMAEAAKMLRADY